MSKRERAALFTCVGALLAVCILSYVQRHNTPQSDKISIPAVKTVSNKQDVSSFPDTSLVKKHSNTRKKKHKQTKHPYEAPPRRDYRNEPIN